MVRVLVLFFGCVNGLSGSVLVWWIEVGIMVLIRVVCDVKLSVLSMVCWLVVLGLMWCLVNVLCVLSVVSERGVWFIRWFGCLSFMV